MFQGFAALIALGAMFFLYFKQGVENEKTRIEESLLHYYNVNDRNTRAEIDRDGIITFAQRQITPFLSQRSLPLRVEAQRILLDRYNSITHSLIEIQQKIPTILRDTIIILSISLTALFLVGYHKIGDMVLTLVGLILIVFSILNLISIKNLILTILKKESP